MKRGRRTAICLAAALVVSAPATSPAGELTTEAGLVKVKVGSQPERPMAGGKTAYTVRLEDPAGTPVSGAKITLSGRMADGMSVVAPLRAATEPGTYRLKSPIELCLLSFGQEDVRPLGGDAVPEIFGELDALGNG